MNQDILLSKIVPNPTDNTWAQAYTTLNVYITLSIEKSEGKTPVTTHGKDLLEKLQREFFALDDKSLENIKKAVENVSKSIGDEYKYSILVGAIVGDILYIVIASEGQVVIKRDSKVGAIATGIENELHGFSGKLKHDDIVVFQTGDFTKKIPLDSLTEYLSANDVLQIAENITPLVHEDSKGTESAIIIQFKDLTDIKETENAQDFELEEGSTDEVEETTTKNYQEENLWTKEGKENDSIEELADDQMPREEPKRGVSLPKFALPKINFANRKILIGIAVIVLLLILGGGIAYQTMKANEQKKEAEFTLIYQPVKEKFDEGVILATLNTTLALEDFNSAMAMADSALGKYSEGSTEFKRLNDLKSQISSKVSEMGGGGSAKNVTEFLTAKDKIKSITAITAKGGTLLVLDKSGEQVVTIDTDGTPKKFYDIESKDNFISADDKFIYTMGTGATSIDRGNGKVTKIAKSVKGTAFDIFGSNIYTLNGDDVLKYKAPAYEDSSYFTDKPSFKSEPTGMSISGPILLIEADGSIERFTKGKKDDFEVTGLQAPFGKGAVIYADADQDNIYVMDVKNQRVVVLNDEGVYATQYEGSFIKDATSFAIDEENKVGYVLSGGKITSFDL